MKLFVKDLVTDELFSIHCEPTDTIASMKHQILMHQNIRRPIHDLTVVVYVPPNHYEKEDSEYSEQPQKDKPLQSGLLQDYAIQEEDILMILYPLE